MSPPVARRIAQTSTLHGETRSDPYAWLREKNDPTVRAYLEAENAYAAAVMASTRGLQEQLYAEMVSRIKETDASVPYLRGAYWYYSRTEAGRQYPVHCRRAQTASAPETILLDLNERGAGEAFIALGDFTVSDDGDVLAYTLDTTGYRQYTLYVIDLRTGTPIGAPIERVDGVVWAFDARTLFYATQDPVTKRTDTIWRRDLAADASVEVFTERDELFDVELTRTRDGSTIIIASVAKDTTECRFIDAALPEARPIVFAPRRDGVIYTLDAADGRWYVRSNEDAPDFALYMTSFDRPERSAWLPVVGARTGTTITGFELFAEFGVVLGRRDGLPSIELLDRQTHFLTPLGFEDADYVVALAENYEFRTAVLRFTYESLVAPRSVFELDVETSARTRLKQIEVPGFDPACYATERRFFTARDGTPIPVSIVQRADVAHDGTAPLLLYGYGSYGISIDAHFSSARLALLDRGVIFAIAHIRGGGEYGEVWRLAGNLMHKQTTFTDFIDCADGLSAAGYTSPDRLAIQGGSAGGLLVGAVTNLRPDLAAAVVAQVPFVDVLTTMLDASLPLTTGEYREWGNPHDAAAYAYMRAYSPLDNVAARPYPAMLIEVALNDSQVPYWEGAKWAATLRASTTSANPILLKTNLTAGHGGSSGRYDKLRETAFTYAFILSVIAPGQHTRTN